MDLSLTWLHLRVEELKYHLLLPPIRWQSPTTLHQPPLTFHKVHLYLDLLLYEFFITWSMSMHGAYITHLHVLFSQTNMGSITHICNYVVLSPTKISIVGTAIVSGGMGEY